MHPFQVTMIVSATVLVLLTALFLIIRTMPSRPGIEWWTASSAFQCVAYLLALIFYGSEKTIEADMAFFSLQTIVDQAIVIGTLLFVGVPIKLKRWILAPVVIITVLCTLLLAGMESLAVFLFAATASAVFIYPAILIFRAKFNKKSITTAAVLFFAVGIHWLNYPFLGRNPDYAHIGFMIGMALAVSIVLTLALLALLQFRDHTKASELQAIYAATHDPLTGLYNRSYLDTLFAQYVDDADQKQQRFMLLYLDLDGFKAVNDRYGHKSGDLVLATIAQRMERSLADDGDAIRIGGDEIVVLLRLSGELCLEKTYQSARGLLNLIEQPITDGQQKHQISASIGACCYQPKQANKNLDDLISCADKLMYKAKQSGGKCVFFDEYQSEASSTKRIVPLKRRIEAPSELA